MSDETTSAPGRSTAERLNAILAAGGAVVIGTYTRATQYGPRHAGWFEERGGHLYVRRGRGRDQLSIGQVLLVGIRAALPR